MLVMIMKKIQFNKKLKMTIKSKKLIKKLLLQFSDIKTTKHYFHNI